MQYSLYCDQVKCLEWGISITDGIVFDYITKCATWCETKAIDEEIYYYISAGNLIENLPGIAKTKSGFNKIVKRLEAKLLIKRESKGNKSYYKVTTVGGTWNKKVQTNGYTRYRQADTLGIDERRDNHSTIYPSNKTEKSQSGKIKYTDAFNAIRKIYPHARTGNKKETYQALKGSGYTIEQVSQEIKLLKRKIAVGEIKHKYLPTMQRRIRELVPTNTKIVDSMLYEAMQELQSTDDRDEFVSDRGENRLKEIWGKFKKQERKKKIQSLLS